MDEFESLNHTQWECLYHVVFIPKGISRNPADPENLIKYSTFNRLCDL